MAKCDGVVATDVAVLAFNWLGDGKRRGVVHTDRRVTVAYHTSLLDGNILQYAASVCHGPKYRLLPDGSAVYKATGLPYVFEKDMAPAIRVSHAETALGRLAKRPLYLRVAPDFDIGNRDIVTCTFRELFVTRKTAKIGNMLSSPVAYDKAIFDAKATAQHLKDARRRNRLAAKAAGRPSDAEADAARAARVAAIARATEYVAAAQRPVLLSRRE